MPHTATNMTPLTQSERELAATVAKMAEKFASKIIAAYRLQYADKEDLINEMMLGAMRATKSWDPKRGRFTTHSAWWMRSASSRFLESRGVIRLPAHVLGAWRHYYHHDGMDPETGQPLPKPSSYTTPRGNVDDLDLADATCLKAAPTEMNAVDADDQYRAVVRAMRRLTPRERRIIRLCVMQCRTLSYAERLFGICRERVRQIRDEAINRLREQLGALGA